MQVSSHDGTYTIYRISEPTKIAPNKPTKLYELYWIFTDRPLFHQPFLGPAILNSRLVNGSVINGNHTKLCKGM